MGSKVPKFARCSTGKIVEMGPVCVHTVGECRCRVSNHERTDHA